MPLVRLACRRAERDEAVHVEHQTLDAGVGGVDVGGELRQAEAGQHVGHDGYPIAIDLAQESVAVGLVGEGQHGVGVRMVNPGIGQEGVKQRLDRRARGIRVQHAAREIGHHVVVRHLGPRAQCLEVVQTQAGEVRGFDGAQVGPAALDRQRAAGTSAVVVVVDLDRRVAAAVEHERRFGADEPGGIVPEVRGRRGRARHHPTSGTAWESPWRKPIRRAQSTAAVGYDPAGASRVTVLPDSAATAQNSSYVCWSSALGATPSMLRTTISTGSPWGFERPT